MKNLPLSLLDTMEFYTVSSRTLKILTENIPDDPYVKTLLGNLQQGVAGMEKALGRVLKSNFTSVILEKDEIRDKCFLGLREYIKSKTYSLDQQQASAAYQLYNVLAGNGISIYYMGYAKESARLNTLLSQYRADQYSQMLNVIGAANLFIELEKAQGEFEKTYKLKVETEAEIDFPLLKESRIGLMETIRPLLTYIGSNAVLNPQVYKPLEDKIDEVITDVVALARTRISRNGNAQKKASETKVQ